MLSHAVQILPTGYFSEVGTLQYPLSGAKLSWGYEQSVESCDISSLPTLILHA